MKIHEVKCVEPYFGMVWKGDKPVEIRLNDRNYEEGDLLIQRKYIPGRSLYNGALIVQAIERVLIPENTFVGLAPGYCLLKTRTLMKIGTDGAIYF